MTSTYSRIDQIWRDELHVTIQYLDGSFLARIPMIYLERSGTNDWELVYDIVRALIKEPVTLTDLDGEEIIDTKCAPTPGQYTVRHRDHASQGLTSKTGPEGNTMFIPLNDSTLSSKSRSTRSTTRQSSFRLSLVARDSRCVVTGSPWEACMASHIVPFSRLDVYQRIYIPGISENNLFEPCMGVLLDDRFSRLLDRFKWTIYCRGDYYYFHGPAMPPDYMQYHGKKLNIADGREWSPMLMPERIFCQWHWEQCMQAHARGFSIWPTIEEITREYRSSTMEEFNATPSRTGAVVSGRTRTRRGHGGSTDRHRGRPRRS